MTEKDTRKKEITLTKELGKRLQKKFPSYRIFANRCPSKSSVIRKMWKEVFGELSPPLQPEIDLIIWEPANPAIPNDGEKLRAIELKYFRKTNGKINQSFYKGIEQSLALLQWGFDNVALWQLFDETFSKTDLKNYGCRTWFYIHGLLNLPIEFTPIWVIGNEMSSLRFNVIQADWKNSLQPIQLLDIDHPKFRFSHTHPNPLADQSLHQLTLNSRNESSFLRKNLIEWLRRPDRKTSASS